MAEHSAESDACTEWTCPHHGARNRATQEPSPPYVRCRTGAQTVCTHKSCKEDAARVTPPAVNEGGTS